MTAEQRIETLLNMANNTMRDLPQHGMYSMESLNAAFTAVDEWAGVQAAGNRAENAEYICHLADVIDRLEWALTNTLQELREAQSKNTATQDGSCHYDPQANVVNHPGHYTFGAIEVIKFIDGLGIGYWSAMANAIKYMARADHKGNRLLDLKKARFYTNHMLELSDGMPEIERPETNQPYIPIRDALDDWGLPTSLRMAMSSLIIGGRVYLAQALTYLDKEIAKAEIAKMGDS